MKDSERSFFDCRYLRTSLDEVVYYATIAEGSDPEYTLDFGDGISPPVSFQENFTRLGPNYPDFHYVKHIYEKPGNYVGSVTVENIFGSFAVDSVNEVVVQNPLGHKFSLAPDAINPISYPPGLVDFTAKLVKNQSHSFLPSDTVPATGWANNVHAHWLLGKPDTNISRLQTYGDYEIGKIRIVFFLNFTVRLQHSLRFHLS